MNRRHQILAGLTLIFILCFLLLSSQFPNNPGLPKFIRPHVSSSVSNASLGDQIQMSTVTATTAATFHQGASESTVGIESIKGLPSNKGPSLKDIKIALFETNGWHDEVLASYIHSIGSQQQVALRVFKQKLRFSIEDVLSDFDLPRGLPDYEQWQDFMEGESFYEPDILVMTTCELDFPHLGPRLAWLLKHGKTYIFCVIHNSDVWFKPESELDAVKPWAEKGRIAFIALSPAVAKTLEEKGMETWPRQGHNRVQRLIEYYAPIFPVKLPAPPATPEEQNRKQKFKDSIAIQGNFESFRRDYQGTFEKMQEYMSIQAKQLNSSGLSTSSDHQAQSQHQIQLSTLELHLIGYGEPHPKVPETIQDNVFLHELLPYRKFYDLLSTQSAILPAFATDIYLWRKASSSITASFISGSPLVADKELLRAYSYVGEDAVYLQADNKTDFETLKRVLSAPRQERIEKVRRVRERAKEVIEENVIKMGGWIRKAEGEMGE